MPHELELDQSANASRQNIHLCRQVFRLRQPALLSVTNIHNSFNAALSLELHQVLQSETHDEDREQIAFIIALLSADEGSNRDFARDCAKVLADLVAIMDKLRRTDVHIPSHSSTDFETTPSTTSDHNTPAPLLQSDESAEWAVLPSNSRHRTQPELRGHVSPHPLSHQRELAYTGTVSWLRHESLQRSP